MLGAATLGAVAGGVAGGVVGSRSGEGDAGDATTGTDVADPPKAAPDSPPITLEQPIETTTTELRPREEPDADPRSPLHRLYDLRVAHEVVDDFPDGDATGDRLGTAGWATVLGGREAATASATEVEGGVVHVSTGTSATGRAGLHLGLTSQSGFPVFTMQWRLAFRRPLGREDLGGVVFGSVDRVDSGGTAPAVGIYFLHRLDLTDTWLCGCSGAGGRTLVDTGVPVKGIYRRFEITADGSNLARFSIDDVRVATIDTSIPTAEDRYGSGLEVFKSKGNRPFEVDLDWFYLRRELPR
jgi:hypothetical protein